VQSLNSQSATEAAHVDACLRSGPLESKRELRVLLYSHDSWGLGHLRRSLGIARAVTGAFPKANVLLITGSPCATQFRVPERVDVVKLPAVSKNGSGDYISRSLSHSLTAVTELREKILLAAFRAFQPHVVLVDHQVVGMNGEALQMLVEARQSGVRTIFGVRDVVDAPDLVNAAWDNEICQWALNEAYDRILVYGSPEIFDARREYRALMQLAERVEYTGYLVSSEVGRSLVPVPSLHAEVLVTVGGGEDGRELLDTYLAATDVARGNWRSVIVAGPMMDATGVRNLKRRSRGRPDIDIRRFHADIPSLIQNADAVVSMAGYNSCAEILMVGRPAVLLPRTYPRQEQRIRAERLAERNLVITQLNPTPTELATAVQSALLTPEGSIGSRPPMNGLDYVCRVIKDLTQFPQREAVLPKIRSLGRGQLVA